MKRGVQERSHSVIHMTLDMPEEVLAALRTDPENFAARCGWPPP